MKMDPYIFYEAFVLGNYWEFLDDMGNVRKGINSTVSMYHLSDNFYYYHQKIEPEKIAAFPSRQSFIEFLGIRCPSFIDVQSIANAYKHLYTNANKAHVTVQSGGSIYSISTSSVEIREDCYSDSGKYMVKYRTKDGIEKDLNITLDKVLNYWKVFLNIP